jgi:hypothetical protein
MVAPAPAPTAAAPAEPAPAPVAVATTTTTTTTTTTVVPAPRPPPPIPARGVSTTDFDRPPTPRRPDTHHGLGAILSAATMGAVAWGATIGQVRHVNGCAAGIRAGTIDNSAFACASAQSAQSGGSIGRFTAIKVMSNVSTWALAPVSGALRGNHDAVRVAWDGARARRPWFWILGGVGLSVTGLATSGMSAYVYGGRCGNNNCLNELRAYYVSQQVGQSLFSAGLGMFTYGLVYRRKLEENMAYLQRARMASIRVAPQVGPGMAGAGITGQF